jgi:hypothetical protein
MQSSEVGRSFADSASYADEFIRSHDPDHRFSPWHFVNWPVAKPKFSPKFCGPHCLVSELPKQIELFAERNDNEVRALALSWIIHLVGDMHQPLHIADRNDQGGNQLFIQYPAGEPGCDAGKQKLHHVWDDCLVKLAEQGKNWSDFAGALRGNLTTYKNQPAARGTIRQWAKTSHDLARDVAYSGIKQKTALSAAYLDRSEKIVKSQILNAGITLARILDENFKLAP